jgi:hypothetical protein
MSVSPLTMPPGIRQTLRYPELLPSATNNNRNMVMVDISGFFSFIMPLIYAGFYFLIRSTSLEDLNRIYSKKIFLYGNISKKTKHL